MAHTNRAIGAQVQEAHKQMFLKEWRAYVASWQSMQSPKSGCLDGQIGHPGFRFCTAFVSVMNARVL